MRLIVIYILFLGLIQAFAQPDPEKDPTPDPEARNMRVIPPDDIQTGGDAILEVLTSHTSASNMFVNQTFDLSLIGPGTNLSFVMSEDGADWGFSFSNGRFEDINHIAGSIKEGTYPVFNYSSQEGKYSWPVDAKGDYLPYTLTNESNGPHDQMQKILNSNGESRNYFAGHIGIDAKGNAYIGYISASVNKGLSRESWGSRGSPDERSLPPKFRKALHDKMAEVFKGRGIEQTVKDANKELANGRKIRSYDKFFPADPYHAQKDPINSTFQYLRETLKGSEFEEYLFRAEPRSIGHVFSSQDFNKFIIDAKRYNDLNLMIDSSKRKIEIYKAVINYVDNYTTEDPKKLVSFVTNVLSHKELHELFSKKLKSRFIDIIRKAPLDFFDHLNLDRYVIPSILMTQEEFLELAKSDPDIAARLYKHIINKNKPPMKFGFNINDFRYDKLRAAVTKHHFDINFVDSETFFKRWSDLDPNLQSNRSAIDGATFKSYLERSDPKKIGEILSTPELRNFLASGKLVSNSIDLDRDWEVRKQIYKAFKSYILEFSSNYPEKKGKFVAHILANQNLRNTYADELAQKFSEIISEGSTDFTKYLNSTKLKLPNLLISEKEFIEIVKTTPDLAAGLYPHVFDKYSTPIDFGIKLADANDLDLTKKYRKLREVMLRHHFGHVYLNRHSFFEELFNIHEGKIFEEIMSQDFTSSEQTNLFKSESFTNIDINLPQKVSKTVQTFYYFINKAKSKEPLNIYDKAFINYIVKLHNESMLQNLMFYEGPMRNYMIEKIMAEPKGAEKLAKGIVMGDSYYGTLSAKGRKEVLNTVLNTDLLPSTFKQKVIKEMLIHGNGMELKRLLNFEDKLVQRAMGDFIIYFDEKTKNRHDVTINQDLKMYFSSASNNTSDDDQARLVYNAREYLGEIRINHKEISSKIADYRRDRSKGLIGANGLPLDSTSALIDFCINQGKTN